MFCLTQRRLQAKVFNRLAEFSVLYIKIFGADLLLLDNTLKAGTDFEDSQFRVVSSGF